MKSRRSIAVIFLLVSVGAVLGGCMQPLGSRNGLGGATLREDTSSTLGGLPGTSTTQEPPAVPGLDALIARIEASSLPSDDKSELIDAITSAVDAGLVSVEFVVSSLDVVGLETLTAETSEFALDAFEETLDAVSSGEVDPQTALTALSEAIASQDLTLLDQAEDNDDGAAYENEANEDADEPGIEDEADDDAGGPGYEDAAGQEAQNDDVDDQGESEDAGDEALLPAALSSLFQLAAIPVSLAHVAT